MPNLTQSDDNPVVAGVLTSIVRTLVPLVVGALITAALKAGFSINAGIATTVVTTVVTVLYYALVRLAETYVAPIWGWLLGFAKVPAYPTAVNTTAVPTGPTAPLGAPLVGD